ncbi:MAG TPA: CARDB domain-containing protein [Thermoanaerobaculia bacterium]|nr:CARDB domain-containing protein [Thermoanaerobaculia bacterium]
MQKVRRSRWFYVALVGAVLLVPILPSARAVLGGVVVRQALRAAAATPAAIYVPASAHAGGANGADWRTDLQIHNAGTTATTATIALLTRDNANPSPQTRSVPVVAGASVRLQDVLLNTFSFTGAAALRVTSTSTRLLVTSRTYNLVGEGAVGLPQGASFGQFVRGVSEDTAIPYGEEGRLIQLTQRDASSGLDFRTNVGVVNLTAGTIEVQIDLYRADKTYLGTRSGDDTRLRGFEFRQITEIMRPYGTIADGYAVIRTMTPGGRFLAFATVIDNHVSGDPFFIPAARVVPAAPAPTPTATPTPTPPAAGQPNLLIYKPADWPSCVVCNSEDNCCPPSSVLLSEYLPTVVTFALANTGTARLAGPVRFGLSLDGVLKATATYANDAGVDPGYYRSLTVTWPTSIPIPAGPHTVTVTADPSSEIAETNESDNSCGFTGSWTGIVLRKQGSSGAADARVTGDAACTKVREHGRPERLLQAVEVPGTLPSARMAAAGETWIPAAAHATGVNGTNWRTDLEIHNPGATAADYTIFVLSRDADNTTPTAQLGFSLDAQKSVRYTDVLDSVFHFTGAAALRIVPTRGTILATSRTYNLVGANSVGLPEGASFGQFVPGLAEGEAISSTEEGRLIQLTQRAASSGVEFRTNVGVVNTTASSVDVRLDFYSADGTWLGVKQGSETRLPPYGFRQLTEAFQGWGTIADGYVVARPTTSGGRIFAFATAIDNHATGDPVFIPAERMTASALPTPTPTPTATPTPTPGPGVIAGPGGTTMTLPTGTGSGGEAVSLTAGDGRTLPSAGETLVSTVVKTTVTGSGVAVGNGTFTVTLPVAGTVSDPDKLLLKVATSTGSVYPVAGVWNPTAKTFTAELMKVWDGWTMGVVTSPGTTVTSLAPDTGVSSLGWATPTDWQTCTFRVFNNAPAAPASFSTGVAAAMKKACEHLRGAGFRSPKLWVDGRWNPKARALHLVQGNGPNDPSTSFSQRGNQNDAAFSMAGFTDEQMQSLGQVYFNWDDWASVILPNGWSYDNVTIHELFHAVQAGYDFRDKWAKIGDSWYHAAMGITEGTATLVGQLFQSNLNGIYGGDVAVRSPEPPEKLDEDVLWNCCEEAYARQDFFAYVAKRWNGGSLTDLRWLFQHLSDQTDGQFGKSDTEYYTLYRKAMDFHYQSAFSITLPELFTEFVLDRAYRHNSPALLRAGDGSLPKNSLDSSLFVAVNAWDPAKAAPIVLKNISPLAARAVKIPVSDAARTAKKLTMDVAVTGATLGKQGLRIFVFAERAGVLEAGGEKEITDASKGVDVTVGPDTTTLTVFVVNGSVANDVATVTFSPTSPLRVVPESNSSWAPYPVPGCPDVDWTLKAVYALEWPSSYRLVWNFGDNTPEVTVENAQTATHRWANVGSFEVTARLYALPAGTLLGEGKLPATIAYFEGRFRMTEFRGSSSGTISHTAFLARMALDPTNTYFHYTTYSSSQSAYLSLDPPGGSSEMYLLGQTDPSFVATDCPPMMTISGNTLVMRSSSAAGGNPGPAYQCTSSTITQNGSQIVGTVSFWERAYNASGGIQSEGQGSYTFRGTYVK